MQTWNICEKEKRLLGKEGVSRKIYEFLPDQNSATAGRDRRPAK